MYKIQLAVNGILEEPYYIIPPYVNWSTSDMLNSLVEDIRYYDSEYNEYCILINNTLIGIFYSGPDCFLTNNWS